MNRTAFLTTVFPENEKFLISFFNSLSTQTYKDFDLIIVNDNLKNINYYKNLFSNLNIKQINSSSTSAKNRELGINYCIDKKYDFLVFGDSDDYFQNNRICKSVDLLKKADIVVNDLSLFDNESIYEEQYISNRFKNLDFVTFKHIEDKNIFGFTNTAIKLRGIKKVIFDDDIIAVDWYFFQKILKQGLKAIFTNETVSYYRQHENNSVGLCFENNKYYLWWEKK